MIFIRQAAEPGELVVASYRAAGPTRLGASRESVRRRTHLLVSFDRVRGAKSYAVLIALRDGLRTDYVITRASLNLVVPTVGPLAGPLSCVPSETTSRRRRSGASHEHRGPAAAADAPQAPSSLGTGPEPGEVLRFAFAVLDLPLEQRTSLREQQLVR